MKMLKLISDIGITKFINREDILVIEARDSGCVVYVRNMIDFPIRLEISCEDLIHLIGNVEIQEIKPIKKSEETLKVSKIEEKKEEKPIEIPKKIPSFNDFQKEKKSAW